MGLQVNATDVAKIKIKNTDVELPSVYLRVEFAGLKDGVSLEVVYDTYLSKEDYLLDKKITTDLSVTLGKRKVYTIDPLEEQGRTLAFSKLKADLEAIGLQVSII